jgi:hypothetical protein
LPLLSAHRKIIHGTEFNMNHFTFRKKVIIFLAVFLLCGNNVFANDENQDEISNSSVTHKNKERRFTFQSSPVLLAMDFATLMFFPFMDIMTIAIDLETQYKINDIYNVSFTASFWSNNESKTKDYRIDLKPMFIFRPFKTGLEGFYVGLYPTVGWYNCKTFASNNYDQLFTIVGLGVNTGYKFVFRKGFSMQLGTGIGKSWIIPKLTDILPTDYDNHLTSDLRLITKYIDVYIMDFKIGYSF